MKKVYDGVIGAAVGDALGLPVEFIPKRMLKENPVVDMREYGMHNQPKGVWSDDTSMTLAFLDSMVICRGINYDDIMKRFLAWFCSEMYLCTDRAFGIGKTVNRAIVAYYNGKSPLLCGGRNEKDNGNGSLMRILPLAFYLSTHQELGIGEQMELVHKVSSLTHAHERSLIACGIYIMIGKELILDELPFERAIERGIKAAVTFYRSDDLNRWSKDLEYYEQIMDLNKFRLLPEECIISSGYVVHTLETAIWCLLNTSSYEACVLRAVNFGGDTDTAASVVGGLAGIYYGSERIPEKWLRATAKREYIETLCNEFQTILCR